MPEPELEPQHVVTSAGVPAATAAPAPPAPPLPTPDPSSLRTTPARDPFPSPGVSVSHPEDECVDQEDALETSDDRFGLQPPRRGRHD